MKSIFLFLYAVFKFFTMDFAPHEASDETYERTGVEIRNTGVEISRYNCPPYAHRPRRELNDNTIKPFSFRYQSNVQDSASEQKKRLIDDVLSADAEKERFKKYKDNWKC